ncbi:glycoside hydrolase family 16 protein [Infundibulicybe gibba]|nr:glycoside hydrolase family 16 protein [Infundibulicybe gibba]
MSLPHYPSAPCLSSTPLGSPGSPGTYKRETWVAPKFSLSPDPRLWGSDLSPDLVEPDDALHNPDTKPVRPKGGPNFGVSARGLANLGCLGILCTGALALFIGYPIASYRAASPIHNSGFNSGGQAPSMGNFGLIDLDTPSEVHTKASLRDGSDWRLVFSDEFNTDGRSFYPGDDPYWEAVDLHYWATNNLEWYDPAAVTTANGSLVITFSQFQNHDLNFQGGLNKFCFTGGLVEASVQLPGTNNVVGMWPAVWTMGNLGRAGYGATLEGMWPYTYDSCDVGVAPNQTLNGLPLAATTHGDTGHNGALSFLPGQKLSRCTCDGEDHPGPKHSDGTYVGRSAPEIDIFEAQPFNYGYIWDNSTENMILTDPTISQLNTFIGSITQQATSVVTSTNQVCYELVDECYSIYAFEYITWVSDNKTSWTLNAAGVGADPTYLIVNLGMSKNFGEVDFNHLTFPNHLRVDYIRVYQPPDAINIGCDPKSFPTLDYINAHIEAYTNPNLTDWRTDYLHPFPKNSFIESC